MPLKIKVVTIIINNRLLCQFNNYQIRITTNTVHKQISNLQQNKLKE